ncbi:hypothetical protein HDU76_005618 [Blyttiomyces sp. JEL0837]|nr:hypothetical protein HDU76_005618 [Blyttiomyces sp. JEL0837]
MTTYNHNTDTYTTSIPSVVTDTWSFSSTSFTTTTVTTTSPTALGSSITRSDNTTSGNGYTTPRSSTRPGYVGSTPIMTPTPPPASITLQAIDPAQSTQDASMTPVDPEMVSTSDFDPFATVIDTDVVSSHGAAATVSGTTMGIGADLEGFGGLHDEASTTTTTVTSTRVIKEESLGLTSSGRR